MADLSQTAANVVVDASPTYASSTAAETITAGQPVYTVSDGTYGKCDATNTTKKTATGIALHGALAGQPLRIQTGGDINLGATLAKGGLYCVSANAAGAIAPYGDLGSTNWVCLLGIAISTSLLRLMLNATSVVQKP
jgi:hypothetical protein